MAIVTISFEDDKDGEIIITYDSDTGNSAFVHEDQKTNAEHLASVALDMVQVYLEKSDAKIEMYHPKGEMN